MTQTGCRDQQSVISKSPLSISGVVAMRDLRHAVAGLAESRAARSKTAAARARAALDSAGGCKICRGYITTRAEARRGDRAGLAGHGSGEALALQGGRQVDLRGGQTGEKKFHDTSPCTGYTGCLREWSGASR